MRSLAEHISDPWSPPAGTLPDGVGMRAATGCAGGSCGVAASFLLEVDEDAVIRRCVVQVKGSDAARATASAFAEAATGATVLGAAGLGLGALHPDFSRLDGERREHALVVEDALHHAIGGWLLRRMRSDGGGAGAGPDVAVVVAMSGGVDSAVALHEEHAAHGGAVAGVTLGLWIDPKAPDPEAACCSPASVRRARATCHALGVPHVSLDLRADFARRVVAPFIAAYRGGETPNPCVGCNGAFRLDELVRLADAIGATGVATGHYARGVERDGVTLVQRGVDAAKDQSYMLCTLDPSTLARIRFPLGDRTKPQVRERAARLGLVQADVPDSQEVCFLGGGDYRAFLQRMDALGPAGEVRGVDGRLLGSHDGIARFTPGQRRGIGRFVAQGALLARPGDGDPLPLYVTDIDPRSGTVTVGDRSRLARRNVALGDVRLHVPAGDRLRVHAQLRYRSGGQAGSAMLTRADGERPRGGWQLTFDEPVVAPAPGQVACLYDADDVVIGAGTIVRRVEPAGSDAAFPQGADADPAAGLAADAATR